MKWMGFGKEKLDLIFIKQKTYEIGSIIGVISFLGLILTLLVSYKLRRKKHQLQQELNVRKLAEQKVTESYKETTKGDMIRRMHGKGTIGAKER